MNTIRQYCAALRMDGFTLQFRDRSGGTTVTQFAKRIGNRQVKVQLWANGGHRASHGTYKRINGCDCLSETTMPTDFTSLGGMRTTILREFKRPSTKTTR